MTSDDHLSRLRSSRYNPGLSDKSYRNPDYYPEYYEIPDYYLNIFISVEMALNRYYMVTNDHLSHLKFSRYKTSISDESYGNPLTLIKTSVFG